MKFKPFEISELKILDLASDGRGVARYEERVVFIKHALPGDTVRVKVYKQHKNYFEAEVLELMVASEHRVDPQCEHFGICGGCKFQSLSYEQQLAFKQKQVEDAFLHIAKIKPEKMLSIVHSPKTFYYRNKVEFSFCQKGWKPTPHGPDVHHALGFHVPNTWDKVLDLKACYLQDEFTDTLRLGIKEEALRLGISFYEPRSQTGLLRNLLLRNTLQGEWMVCLIVKEKDRLVDALMHLLIEKYTSVNTFVLIVNPKANDSYQDLAWEVYKGSGYIYEMLDGKRYRISPTTFFQTNSRQALNLYCAIQEQIPNGVEVLYDLYAGCGSIGIFVAEKAKKVVGIEYVTSAVHDAHFNATLNGYDHLFYEAGDIAKLLSKDFIKRHGKPDVLITDPPRAGMDAKVCESILSVLPPLIIYVSCNPATQARDVQILSCKYNLISIQPFDLFPHTYHVESLAVLNLKDF